MPLVFTLAFRNLFHDRVRFVATLVGIIFSVTLVTGQLGLFLGFERMVTAMIDRAHGDLWIAPLDTKSFEATALLDGHERFQALPIEGVREVIPVITKAAATTTRAEPLRSLLSRLRSAR